MIERWKQIEPLLNEFQDHLAKDVQKLSIKQLNDKKWLEDEYKKRVKAEMLNQYGVYLIFDGDDEYALQYIGLAMDKFDNRIWEHEGDVDRRFTDIIPFEHKYYFLAPALEFFLISKLSKKMPKLKNKIYRGHSIAESSLNQGV